MISAVLDTAVFVRYLTNPRSRWGRLVFDRGGDYQLVVSAPVQAEIAEVLSRRAITRRFRFVAGMDRPRWSGLLAGARTVDVDIEIMIMPPVARDPNDDKFLATAHAASANYLVTEDDDLLVLGEYRGTRIVDTATFLTLLDRPTAPAR